MDHNKEEANCLASLAVFRELYNKKKDIYEVICAFLNEIITSNIMYKFSIPEISNLLKSKYEFSIPDAVISTAVGRLSYLKKEHGVYRVVEQEKLENREIPALQTEVINSNNIIISSLFEFIQVETKSLLTETEKDNIKHSFCSFLLDNTNGENYTKYISAFLIKNQNDINVRNKINKIREGVILYSGLTYNNNLNDLGSWKTELTIYLDTEILFHFAGYNGEVYKILFNDFHNYVKEINSKSTNRLIHLRYFNNVTKEIDGFFTSAQYIIEGKESLSPKGTAMNSIVKGCKTLSDIEEKKSDFYLLLKTNGIKEDDTTDYYDRANYLYNIIDQRTIDKLTQDLKVDIADHLQTLNLISIKRKRQNYSSFENVGYILLTGNSTTLKVAWNEEIKTGNTAPLATSLDFLTNRFWFKLNKGFGDKILPKSFDIITKAQIVLSAELDTSIGEKYEELQTEYRNGTLTKEKAQARIVCLRNMVRKPEDIERDDLSSVLEIITIDSIDHFIQDQEHFKNKSEEQGKENIHLKKVLESTKTELENKEKEALLLMKEKTQKELEIVRNKILTKELLLKEKEITLNKLLEQKIPLDKESLKSFCIFKIGIGISMILFYALVCLIIRKITWAKIEPWTYIITILCSTLIPMLLLLINEKEINPRKYLSNKKTKFYTKTYSKFNFDINRLNSLDTEILQLNTEIHELKGADFKIQPNAQPSSPE